MEWRERMLWRSEEIRAGGCGESGLRRLGEYQYGIRLSRHSRNGIPCSAAADLARRKSASGISRVVFIQSDCPIFMGRVCGYGFIRELRHQRVDGLFGDCGRGPDRNSIMTNRIRKIELIENA